MKGFGPFLFGCVVGGSAVFATLSYHFVQAKDGFHAIPRLSPNLVDVYVDARTLTPADWQQHKELVAAILRANQAGILGDSAVDQATLAAQAAQAQAAQALQQWLPNMGANPGGNAAPR